jgi:diadenylate cyclase
MDLLNLLFKIGWTDLIDILVVSTGFYAVFAILRQGRSYTALRGLLAATFICLVIWVIAHIAGLVATARLLQQSLPLVIIFFVILFQAELKKALTDFGQTSIFRPFLQTPRVDTEEIIKALTRLAERRTGALIAIERRNSLAPYSEVGTVLDSQVSAELIRTIFAINTPLHDGAIIIRGSRIAAAGCLLPLSENPQLPKDFGTRHRAGIGLTEETDAVVLICSEETGIISIAANGTIERNQTADTLRTRLQQLLGAPEERRG